MKRKLWVPSPSQARPAPREPGRRARAQRKKTADRTAAVLAALIVALGLLTICLLLTAVPALFSSREGGRINLLLLGIDRRDGTGWAYRTDTIMVVTVDPETRAAAILSIPRDLQLAIPGHGEDRINTANVYGYRQDNPEGGPALLKATIEANFGIPVDGHFMVDFQAFEGLVDTLGGSTSTCRNPCTTPATRTPSRETPMPSRPYTLIPVGSTWMESRRSSMLARA